jgi:hypothetical protein
MMLILADLPDHALTTRLLEIRKHERSLLVELLGLLAELDRRRTVLALGFSSLFSFCTDRLGLTKASAFVAPRPRGCWRVFPSSPNTSPTAD